MNEIANFLFSQSDEKYKKFQSSLIPNIDSSKIIGVRAPALKKYARELAGKDSHFKFFHSLPHTYHEQNTLHAYLISGIKDFDECIEKIDSFLPFVDNWAVCDSLRPVCFKYNTQKLMPYVEKWIASPHTYTSRFGIEMLMLHFLGDNFNEKIHNLVICSKSDDYYHKMMKAWYFATALSKQYEKTLPFITSEILGQWVFKKTIQKAIESRCLTDEQKNNLKSLKAEEI